MKLITNLTALSLVICASMIPLTAQANNNYQTQEIILNNFNNQEQILANQVNAYVNSGQLSPQQGAVFNSELNQISSQSMAGATDPNETAVVMNELSSLAAQITASLGVSGQWYPAPAYGTLSGPSRYNWRPRSGDFQRNDAERNQFQSSRATEHRDFQGQQAHAGNGRGQQMQTNYAIPHGNAAPSRAAAGQGQRSGKMIARSNGAHPQVQENTNDVRRIH